MFVDHMAPTELEVKNGWVNPTIQRVVNSPLEGVKISDKEYIKALETMVFWLSFTTGLNTSLGYDDETRPDCIQNFYNSLEKLNGGK
jgi:hypothetical protein